MQFPIALGVFGSEAVKLYREHKKRVTAGNLESICEASIAWTPMHIAFCALCGILGGTVGGLLGSGGGFILGPLLLEIGVIPQVLSESQMLTKLNSYLITFLKVEIFMELIWCNNLVVLMNRLLVQQLHL